MGFTHIQVYSGMGGNKMCDDIVLSICCAVYNHEAYLRKALDSVLSQECSYKFEVLVAEDCSTDKSRDILYEYEKKHPGFFTMIYRDRNYGPKDNFSDMYKRTKGKYIIVLETDDYWIDYKKIQKQIDILEKDPSLIGVAHNTMVVDSDGCEICETYPECHSKYYGYEDFRRGLLPGQTTTIMHRNIYNMRGINMWLIENGIGPGDRRKVFTLMQYGKIACIQETMSAYRHVLKGGSSFSANLYPSVLNEIDYYRKFHEYCIICSATKEAASSVDYVLFKNYCAALWKKRISIREFYRGISDLNHVLSFGKFIFDEKVKKDYGK